MPITVSIVEDNEQLRGTLARVIGRAEGFKCVSQYANAEAALAGLPKDDPQVDLAEVATERQAGQLRGLQAAMRS